MSGKELFIAVAFLLVGVFVTSVLFMTISKPQPLTPAQAAAVKLYNNLPESAKMVLIRKDLEGMTVSNVNSDPFATSLLVELMRHGARTGRYGEADLDIVFDSERRSYVVHDKSSNIFAPRWGQDADEFAESIVSIIGAERKRAALRAAQKSP